MIVYADIYILINFVCNCISFMVCAAVTCSKLGYIRLCLSAFIMSLYSFFMLFVDIYPLLRMMIDCFVLITGTVMAFGKNKPVFVMRNSFIYFVSCVVTGGIAGMFLDITYERAAVIILVTPLIYLVWCLSVKSIKHSKKYVSVIIDGQQLSGLSDSGNMLFDNQKGVHIIVAKSEKLYVDDKAFEGWIKTETVCGTGYMPYYYPKSVEIDRRKVRAAVALSSSADFNCDCIVPIELT